MKRRLHITNLVLKSIRNIAVITLSCFDTDCCRSDKEEQSVLPKISRDVIS